MIGYKYIFPLFVSGLLLFSCSTSPEFERDNPYDRSPESDPFGVEQFPPPNSIHTFTHKGIRISMPGNYKFSLVEVFRKRGSSDFEAIGTFQYNPENLYYFDSEIDSEEDIGYPLSYRFTNAFGTTIQRNIDFGSLDELTHSETNDEMVILWKDRVYMNHGVQIVRERNGVYTEFADIPVPDSSFTFPSTTENLNSTFLLSPYRNFESEKTFLDTTYFFSSPAAPSDLDYEILSSDEIKLTWTDNSSIETGFIVVDNINNDTTWVAPNIEELLIKKEVNIFEEKSYSVYALLENIESDKITIQFQIPDFPYPEITGIEHIDKQNFRIYFRDRVSFKRIITFKTRESIQVSNEMDYADIYISNRDKVYADLNLTAELSYGWNGSRTIPITRRPSLDLKTIGLNSGITPKTLDVKTVGDLLIYSLGNIIYKVDLSQQDPSSSTLLTLPDNITLIRLSNDNTKAFASTESDVHYLIDINQATVEKELTGLPGTIFDASFIDQNQQMAISSQSGFFVYDTSSESLTSVPGLNSTNELEFFGTSTETRLLALDRDGEFVHYFNTIPSFSYYNSVNIEGVTVNGFKSPVNNVAHLNSSYNILSFEHGGGYFYSIDTNQCSDTFVCWMYMIGPYQNDRNAFIEIINDDLRIITTNNYIRLIHGDHTSNLHVNSRQTSETNLIKINRMNKVLIDFDEVNNSIGFYDLNEKWLFTNYGVYDDIVWPEN